MKKITDKSAALNLFEQAALKHSEATEEGDYKTGNKNYTLIIKAINFLKEKNEVSCLTSFLKHPSAGVRCWAALYLLPICENEAVRTLEDLSKNNGFHSLDAETTLSEWRKGNLIL